MTPLAIARRIVRYAAHLVPRWRRSEWEREWQAELHSEAESPEVIERSTGAIADDLIGDVHVATPGVASPRDLRHGHRLVHVVGDSERVDRTGDRKAQSIE